MAFVNIAGSGNKRHIEETSPHKDSSREKKSFLQQLFSGRKENSSATQLKAAGRSYAQIVKPVNYTYITDLEAILVPEDDPLLARFKR